MNSGAFINRSQLDDNNLDEVQKFRKMVRRPDGYLQGLETPLGHVYSVVLEELSRQGKDAKPDVNGFLSFVESRLTDRGSYLESIESRRTDLLTPSYYPTYTWVIMEYIKSKGLPYETCEKVMKDIMGFNPYDKRSTWDFLKIPEPV